MKLTIPKSTLVNTIRSVIGAGAKGVRITVRKDKVAFTTSDGDLSIRGVLTVTDAEDGDVFVSATDLGMFAQRMPEGPVKLSLNAGKLVMTSGKVSMTVTTQPVANAPTVSFPTGDGVTIPAQGFSTALSQVIDAAAKDVTRPALTGVLLEAREQGLRLVATDSYRLAVRDVPGNSALPEGTSIVAPAMTLKVVAELLSSADEVLVRLVDNVVGFEIPGIKVAMRLINSAYPDYSSVLPSASTTTVLVDRSALHAALQRAVVANERNGFPIVHLSFSPVGKKVDMSAANLSGGTGATEELEISGQGDAIKIAANPRYILEAVSQLKSDTVRMSFSGPLRPVLVSENSDSPELRYVVMPSRV